MPNNQPLDDIRTVNSWAAELGADRRTLIKYLAGVTPAKVDGNRKYYRRSDVETFVVGSRIGAKDIQTLRADQIRAQTEESKARKRLLAKELAEKNKTLVPIAEVHALITSSFLPIRQRFQALPSEMCALCNPTDPAFARQALEGWVAQAMKTITEQLPKDEL